ncbi:Nem1-Spo7 phosphatase regulatory subunit [Martiniozyma asiatica (nom. inval.)]|nr:Nem1-Spo7 phosphatase regulatory subunit [Martiniozyma asiatica]
MDIDEPQLLDLQSPPSSPGLVLPQNVPSTNEHIDAFILEPATTVSMGKYRKANRQSSNASSPDELTDDDLLNLNTGSDSYFSHHRENSTFINPIRSRRRSDVSIRSDASLRSLRSSIASLTESDNESRSPFRSFKKKAQNQEGSVKSVLSSELTHGSRSRSTSRSRARSQSQSQSQNRSEVSTTAHIFKNLLILEESLRQQHTQQTKLRYKYFTFLISMITLLLFSLNIAFFYQFPNSSSFINENITIYELTTTTTSSSSATTDLSNFWIGFFRLVCQIVSIIDFITLLLFYLSGEYHRTILRPQKFLNSTNKGIRQLNVRLVKIRVKTMDRLIYLARNLMISQFSMLNAAMYKLHFLKSVKIISRFSNVLQRQELSLRTTNNKNSSTGVKLVLNARVFSTATREQWELYRNQFWNIECKRRNEAIAEKALKR